jgi:hypothetical protein
MPRCPALFLDFYSGFFLEELYVMPYLALFPNDRFDAEGVPAGFSEDQQIPKHLLVNVIYFSLPKTWLTTMTTHGFDYMERDDPKGDLIKFCKEHIEVLEHEQPAAKKGESQSSWRH